MFLSMRKFLIVLFIVLLAGCVSREQEQTHQTKAPLKSTQPYTLPYPIKVNKRCPNKQCVSYALLIDRDGLLSVAVNEITKPLKIQLTSKEVKQVKQRLKALKLKKLHTQITPGQTDCTAYTSDQSNYEIVFDKGDFPQRLDIYQGCEQLPKRYHFFLDWFDRKSKPPLNIR